MIAEPTLAEVIRAALDDGIKDINVAIPGRVETFNDVNPPTADVLPMIRRAIFDTEGDLQHEDRPVIPNVPIIYPQATGFSFVWPLSKGDFVLLIFNSDAIGLWRQSGTLSNPGDLRKHDLSYPVAIPGLSPNNTTLPKASDAAVINIGSPLTHVRVGTPSADFVALSGLVESLVGTLADAILNATVLANDGGATLQTNAKASLIAAGWVGTSPPTGATAAAKLKSE